MRPFKFFFVAAIGIMIFFFLAKVFIMAFFFAAIMSLVFFAFRSIKNAFMDMRWQDHRHEYQSAFSTERHLLNGNQKHEFLFKDWNHAFSPKSNERIIKL